MNTYKFTLICPLNTNAAKFEKQVRKMLINNGCPNAALTVKNENVWVTFRIDGNVSAIQWSEALTESQVAFRVMPVGDSQPLPEMIG